MKVKIGYSRDEEIIPLKPIIEGKINTRNYEFSFEKIKEDEVKFNIDKYELIFIPLPVLGFVKDVKVISNGSYAVERLFIKKVRDEKSLRLLVSGTNSTEYYIVKMLLGSSIIPSFNDYNATISYKEGEIDLYEMWSQHCGKVPIVISVIGSKLLGDDELSKIKAIIRDSASVAVSEYNIMPVSKELGLKGRESMECFFKLCKEKGLCSEIKVSLL